MSVKLPILPTKHHFARIPLESHDLDLKAICIFMATGFFMDDDTYWKDERCLLPSHDYTLDSVGCILDKAPHFKWHFSPKERSFEDVLEEYIHLLTQIMREQLGTGPVILPLSGGLDSRSQAMVLQGFDNPVQAFSYEFQGGYPETKIAKQIASACGFDFKDFQIPKGYLWECIEELAAINKCYSEFTHPRQMAVLPELKQMEGVFSLGHWGDVLFDRGVPEGTTESNLTAILLKKMLKPGGMALANSLWEVWGLEGSFKDYLKSRVETALNKLDIDNLSAKVRAFKTSQWAHRWTTTNLSVFDAAHPMTLPYYDDRMLEFICTVPETYLADRRLQIAHLQQDAALASITWQAQRPFNLKTYSYNKIPYNLPYRVWNKVQHVLEGWMGAPYIQRNYELQFLGSRNESMLRSYLEDSDFQQWIGGDLVCSQLNGFYEQDARQYSHSVSMLLTISLFFKKYLKS